MALRVQPFDRSLAQLPRFIEAASGRSETAGGMVAAGEQGVELVGPFPAFTADPRKIASGDWGGVEPSGWRALARRDGEPVGLVGIVEMGEELSFSLRDAEAASAFAMTLDLALNLKSGDGDYEVRWLALPAIYLTALWLKGAEDRFLPTRAGSAERSAPEFLSRDQMEKLAAQLVEHASRRPQGGSERAFAADSDEDMRSGL
jgi:hypothetical protein